MGIYFNCLNFDITCRSKVDAHQLLFMVKSKDYHFLAETNQLYILYAPLLDELNQLNDWGFECRKQRFKATFMFATGDNQGTVHYPGREIEQKMSHRHFHFFENAITFLFLELIERFFGQS